MRVGTDFSKTTLHFWSLIHALASANVDFASDEALQRAWQALPSETTVIMITHRASSLAWMDRILVMDDGRVVEDGSPAELLGRDDSYYRSCILQSGVIAASKK